MADGKVVYKTEIDDSSVESDLNKSNKKIEVSTKETANKQKKEYKETSEEFGKQAEKRVDDTKSTNKKIENNTDESSGKMAKIWEGVSIGIGAKFADLALDVGKSLGEMALGGAINLDKAMNQFSASTGVAKDDLKGYEDVLKNIYGNNYGDSFEDIAQAMGNVKQQMGNLTGEELQRVTENAFALRDTFDFDVNESVRSAKMMMDQFGIASDEAFNLIAQGAQKGLNKNGDLLDTVNEYSVHFKQLGFDAKDMFNMLENGAENGTFSMDALADAVKEFGIKMKNGSASEVLQTMGLDADNLAMKFAKGGDDAKEAFAQVAQSLSEMDDPLAQSQAGVTLFGTKFEDLGTKGILALTNLNGEFDSTIDTMGQINEVKYDDFGSMLEGLKRQVELLLLPLGDALVPILGTLIDTVFPILTSLLTPLIEIIGAISPPILQIIQSLQPLIDMITSILVPVIQVLGSIFSSVFSGIASTVSGVIGNVTGILNGIITFIKGVFTGNWKTAWNGIKQVFSNIVNGFANIFKAPINWIIDGINGFISGINKIKIPDWVPFVGGKGFKISKIPRLKVGMDFVPNDYFPAYLDYGERVMTKEENTIYSKLGGMQGILNNSFIKNGTEIDYERLFDIVQSINFDVYMDSEKVGGKVTNSVDKKMGITGIRKERYGV
ncbi:phage tail tape measure protein [Thomasclavelia cocleata]|uniref:phage tail tape measure protein n=1 Tax=Thomasclavelia cocleata TaxID=69824 RepID=UPI00242D7B89|nr:phage tail tape measure protein [Thomasclavelia cocleata]